VIGEPRTHVEECESTQLLLGPEDPEGAVATSDYQSGGRGRLGRTWVAPPGTAIHCSVLLRPPAERSAPQLSLVGGLAAAEAVELATRLSVQIKWPNDVMLNRRKVAGVLSEDREKVVVLGIGINVNQAREQLPADARQPPGSLRSLTGREYGREELLAVLLQRLDDCYSRWRSDGLDALYGELGARDFLRGRRVTVDGAEGLAEGIDRQGRLLVAGRAVESGEVEYER